MSPLASREILRPTPGGLKEAFMAWSMEQLPLVFMVARAVWPIPRFGNTVIATRYDHVREVFLNDDAFGVPYRPKLMSSWVDSRFSSVWAIRLSTATTRQPCGRSSG